MTKTLVEDSKLSSAWDTMLAYGRLMSWASCMGSKERETEGAMRGRIKEQARPPRDPLGGSLDSHKPFLHGRGRVRR
jgi:hypothetical protein